MRRHERLAWRRGDRTALASRWRAVRAPRRPGARVNIQSTRYHAALSGFAPAGLPRGKAPPPTRRAAFAASLWQLPRRLVHPLVLTFLTAALFSDLSADTVRAACLLAVGLALAWDQARSRAPPPSRGAGESGPGTSRPVTAFSD